MFEKYDKSFGKDDPHTLVIQAPTTVLNPTIPQAEIDLAMADDPEAARAEWHAQFRDDISNFIDRASVEACVAADVRERPPAFQHRYVGFVDVSGGRHDSMTLAIAHHEGDTVILDAVREIRAPFNPEAAVEEFATLLRSYRLARVIGDKYAAEWTTSAFQKVGIHYKNADKAKSELYVGLLPAINSRAISLLDNSRLISQFCQLERRTTRGGRRVDTVDHPRGAMDDLANAVARALIYANRTYRSSFAQHRAPGKVIVGYADVKRASGNYGPRTGQG